MSFRGHIFLVGNCCSLSVFGDKGPEAAGSDGTKQGSAKAKPKAKAAVKEEKAEDEEEDGDEQAPTVRMSENVGEYRK